MTPAVFPDLWPIFPELFLALAAMALLMTGVFLNKGASAVVSAGSIVVLASTLVFVGMQDWAPRETMNGLFVADALGGYLKTLVLSGGIIAILLAIGYLRREQLMRFEYPVLVLFATLGMMLMVSANDFITLYIGLELQSLSLYVLASFHRDTARSSEAGLKYFTLGALASGMLLYGASMVYGFGGSTEFDTLARVLATEDTPHLGMIFGLVFVTVGLAFKVSAVPFHMWTPDVYEGAPTPVTALFAMAPKVAAMGLFLRVLLEPFGTIADQWVQIIVLLSVASMVLGAFAALRQPNIKRLMAYSSIGHMGYTLLGVAAAGTAADPASGIQAVVFYMTVYLFMNAGVFAVILCMQRNGRSLEQVDDLAGMSRAYPGLALAMAILMFSMAGIPPLAGFFSKLYVFWAAIEAGLYGAAIIGVLSSVVAAFYYLRVIKVMYFDSLGESFDHGAQGAVRLVLIGATLFTVGAAAFLGPLLSGTEPAAQSLIALPVETGSVDGDGAE